MNNLAVGTAFFTIFLAVIGFIVAALILRWIFRINKIVDLLEEIREGKTPPQAGEQVTQVRPQLKG